MNIDPFSYFVQQSCQVKHDKAKELAIRLREQVFYKKTHRIFKNHDLTIERKEYYNFT